MHFLELVASDLLSRFGADISNITLVFPNRRASLFFNQYLSRQISKPIWQPKVTTIADMMFGLSGLKPVDPLSLVFRLYRHYGHHMASAEPFDSFYFWGEVMVNDFDQIDKYRVDSRLLFANVHDIKEIEERFGGLTAEQLDAVKQYLGIVADENRSMIRENYMRVWRVLGAIYTDFRESLVTEGIGYEGLAFRVAADRLDSSLQCLVERETAFVGFNALNSCEVALFRHLKRYGRALFYWDYDTYYTRLGTHEASLFMLENLREFPNRLGQEHFNNFRAEKRINLISAPTSVSQTKLIPGILERIKNEGVDINVNTAIVLPEEHLLLPSLSALPQNIGDINITMGYPLRDTAAYSLVEYLTRLQVNARVAESGEVRFYFRDVVAVLNHPYVRLVDSETCDRLMGELLTKNAIFALDSSLAVSQLTQRLFRLRRTGADMVDYLLDATNLIASEVACAERSISFDSQLELEFLYSMVLSLNRVKDLLAAGNVEVSLKVFQQLFRKVFAQQRVSFSGEPISGLQIMGFLETRCLDFDNLIILSVNDDVIPGSGYRPSFITPSLRRAYGLPDYRHQDAIYAYYFYRLLQRAQNVYLVYRSRAEGLSSGEVSRFALQLMYESGKSIASIGVKFNLGATPRGAISVEKSPAVMARLGRYLDKNNDGKFLSPSALTSYLVCPLRFYFRYVADIREPDEVTEEVDLPGFGKILHTTMELIYNDIDKKYIESPDIEKYIKQPGGVSAMTERAFALTYLKSETGDMKSLLSGRNRLFLEQIKYLVNKMLLVELNRTPFELIGHEQKVEMLLPFSQNRTPAKARVGGYIDRLERRDDKLTVIDYKTGKPKLAVFDSIQGLFEAAAIDKTKEVFQVFTYCAILESQYPGGKIKPAVWFVRNASPEYRPEVRFNRTKDTQEVVDSFAEFTPDFRNGLSQLLMQIFDDQKPFLQTNEVKSCKTCPYLSICGSR
jgi:CRISPR/Cas system-associated exonuclease Cas4 (RecB family)